ncbi:L-ascorbate oxidase -like protein [Capsicum chinense]|nr:L-ascorbate oxidase -like protein [Capsicum chinense]
MGNEIEKLKTNEDKLKSIARNQLTQQCVELCRSEDIKVPELEEDNGTLHKTHNIYQSTSAVVRGELSIVEEVVIPGKPNIPEDKRNNHVPTQPCIEGDLFDSSPSGDLVSSIEVIEIKRVDEDALAGLCYLKGGGIRAVKKDMVNVFLLCIIEVALATGSYPYVIQVSPSKESIMLEYPNENFDFCGDLYPSHPVELGTSSDWDRNASDGDALHDEINKIETERWSPEKRKNYNLLDAVSRDTIQVYLNSFTVIMNALDNAGLWNVRSNSLERHYLDNNMMYSSLTDTVGS